MRRRNPSEKARPAALMIAILGAISTTALADGPRGAEWVAADAVAYLEVARPADLLGRLTGGPIPALLESTPDYRKYIEGDEYLARKKAVDAVAARLGTTWDRGLLDLLGGGVVLAVEPASPPRAILIATPRDPDFPPRALETLLVIARDDAAAKGQPDPVRPAEHRGVRGYTLGPKLSVALVGGSIVVGESPETVRLVIDRSIDKPEAAKTLAGDPLWQARRAAHLGPDSAAWAFVRVDRVRQIHPDAFRVPEQVNPLGTLLFADWIEAVRKAPWVSAGLAFTNERLAVDLTLPTPPGGFSDALRRYLPPKGKGAPPAIAPKGMIASATVWRDLSGLWEVRSELFPPPVVQGFAQLDTVAGTFFGGRDFGTGVLGALGSDWRLIVARQDFSGFDPVPVDKVPAFALVADLKPDDEEFAIRLKSAFQSFVGLVNLGSAQTKAPPLMLGSEEFRGVTIATSRFIKPKAGAGPAAPVHIRHNFSPSAAQVGDHFILGSSLGLVRDLVSALQVPSDPTGWTLLVHAEGAELAALVGDNRPRLVMQNMLEKGNDKPKAEAEVDFLQRLLRTLGRGSLTARDTPDDVRFRLDFSLQAP